MSHSQVELKDKKTGETAKTGGSKSDGFKGLTQHTWSWEKLSQEFPNSGLDLKNLDKSKGLSTSKIEELRKIHGYNKLTPQKEVSKIILFLK